MMILVEQIQVYLIILQLLHRHHGLHLLLQQLHHPQDLLEGVLMEYVVSLEGQQSLAQIGALKKDPGIQLLIEHVVIDKSYEI